MLAWPSGLGPYEKASLPELVVGVSLQFSRYGSSLICSTMDCEATG